MSNHNPNHPHHCCWIYHERQFGQLCGQHALNNFVQGPTFTIVQLSEIAQQLDEMESNILLSSNHNNRKENENHRLNRSHTSRYDPPGTSSNSNSSSSHHVDEAGNFSIEVLKAALLQTYNVNLVHHHSSMVQEYLQTYDITTIQGFICHKNDHWFCIRKLHHRYWNLNSTLEYPTVISHFTLATEMEQYATQQGYTIFCILPPHTTLPEPPSSLPTSPLLMSDENSGRWYTMAELLSPSSTTISTTNTTTTTSTTKIDPWEKLNGTGRRLDGQHSSNHLPLSLSESSQSYTTIDGLTEEEMLQLALQQSMEPTVPIVTTTTTSSSSSLLISTMVGPVPPEPDEHCNDCIKIQFRFPLPYNTRIIRRFHSTNTTIADIYHYVNSIIATTNFECMVGYPPKNMLLVYPNPFSTTIQETNLANATIQVRLLS